MLNLTLYASDNTHLGQRICHLRTLWAAHASPNAVQANLQEIGRLIYAGLGVATTGDDDHD